MTPERLYWMSFANGFHHGLTDMYEILTKKRCLPDQALREVQSYITRDPTNPGYYDGVMHGMRMYFDALIVRHIGMKAAYKQLDTYWENVLIPWVQAKLPTTNMQPPVYDHGPLLAAPPPRRPTNTFRIIIAAALAALAALAIFCTLGAALIVQGDRLTRAFSIIEATNTVPTETPTITPTPYLGIGDVATLGGTPKGFARAYNLPTISRNFAVTINGLLLSFNLFTKSGTDTHDHIEIIEVSPYDQSGNILRWTATQAQHTLSALLPVDAQPVRSLPLGKNSIEYIDHSVALAATFPAALFTDINNKPQSPGTFSYACDVGTPADGCILSLQI